MSHSDSTERTDARPANSAETGSRQSVASERLRELSLPHVDLSTCSPDHRSALLERIVDREFVLVVGNDLKVVPLLVDALARRFVDASICDRPTAGRLGVALGEAVVNAIVHGNLEVGSDIRDDPDDLYDKTIDARRLDPRFRRRRVHLICAFNEYEGRITVRDDGPGFDISAVPDPTEDQNLTRPYGRGILLIRAFFDEVQYSAKGNSVTMRKLRVGPTGHDGMASSSVAFP